MQGSGEGTEHQPICSKSIWKVFWSLPLGCLLKKLPGEGEKSSPGEGNSVRKGKAAWSSVNVCTNQKKHIQTLTMRRESGLDRHVQADHEVSICTYLQHICICIHIYICVCFHTYIYINIEVYISFPISTPSSVPTSASPIHLYLCLHLFLCPQVPMAHTIKERGARQGTVPKYFHFHYPLRQLYREHLCCVWSGSITTSGEAIFPYYPDIHLIVSFLHPARPGLQLTGLFRW